MNRHARHTAVRRGVTLIEVLATLLLLAIVLPVAMRGITLSMQAASHARHTAEAARLAESKLNELVLMRDASYLNGFGDFGDAWPEYRWQSRSYPASYGLYEVAVTVSWPQRGRDRSITISTLTYLRGQEPDEALDETAD